MSSLEFFLQFVIGLVVVVPGSALMMWIWQSFRTARRALQLRDALTEAVVVINYEVKYGRYPEMLKKENGGKGLQYLQDTLNG